MSNLTLLAHLHLIFRTFSNQYKPNPIKNNPISCNPICSSGSATPAAASINNWKLFRMISHVFSAISLVLTSRGFVPVASSRRYYFFIVSFFFFHFFVSAFLRAKSDGNRRHFFFVSCTEIDKEGAGGGGGGGGRFHWRRVPSGPTEIHWKMDNYFYCRFIRFDLSSPRLVDRAHPCAIQSPSMTWRWIISC